LKVQVEVEVEALPSVLLAEMELMEGTILAQTAAPVV
jgi:hypothetical protein